MGKKAWIFAITIIALLVVYFLASSITGFTIFDKAGKYDDFAKALTEKGVKMYGAYWCSHCANQKKLFGSSFKYVNYVECSLPNAAGQTAACTAAGIQSYPTWEFADGKKVASELSFEQLSQLSGVPLPAGQ